MTTAARCFQQQRVVGAAAAAARSSTEPSDAPTKPVTGADSSRQVVHGIEALLSLDEVARLLCISESGVYRLVRSGELPRVKVGKRTLFEPHEIRRFIASRRDAGWSPVGPVELRTLTRRLGLVSAETRVHAETPVRAFAPERSPSDRPPLRRLSRQTGPHGGDEEARGARRAATR